MKKITLSFLVVTSMFVLNSCSKVWDYIPGNGHGGGGSPKEDAATFVEIGSITIGGQGAAEITAYDPLTKRLFVVTNTGTTQVDVLDLSNPAAPLTIGSIDISPFGGGVNSVAVYDGKLAAAVEGYAKTDDGKIVVFKTTDYSVIKEIPAGALPDMVTFSHDGDYILSANEGEPSDDYLIDPIGTVTIVDVKRGYTSTTIDFSSFAGKADWLKAKGMRLFGPNATFAQDVEPEYLTVSSDSRTAWVTLQENNAIAKIDIKSKRVTQIFPLGFKNYNSDKNGIDVSDEDDTIAFKKWNVKGMYLPDAIAVTEHNGVPLLFTANEGDVREWGDFIENGRIKNFTLDPTVFPNAADLQKDEVMGRLNITNTLGDKDGDGDMDELYSYGGRSFTVWNGFDGQLVFDSKNELEEKTAEAGFYDDGRSDDKGVEPEGVTLGVVGKKAIAFVGMERADAVAIYDISNPYQPKFIKVLATGDAPEGLTFVPATVSPNGKSLLIVSSEDDGTIKVYSVN